MTPAEWGAIASPVVAVVAVVFTVFWTARTQVATQAASEAKRDATDAGLAGGLADLRKSFDGVTTELKVSNERMARHEVDYARFQGSTLEALKALADAAQVASTVRERLAGHDERLNTVENAIEWGTGRFEEIQRALAALAKGDVMPVFRRPDDPAPRAPSHRAPHRGRKAS
jgi:hypothetical protein